MSDLIRDYNKAGEKWEGIRSCVDWLRENIEEEKEHEAYVDNINPEVPRRVVPGFLAEFSRRVDVCFNHLMLSRPVHGESYDTFFKRFMPVFEEYDRLTIEYEKSKIKKR